MRFRQSLSFLIFGAFSCFLWLTTFAANGDDRPPSKPESLADITARLAKETAAAYETCRFSALSKDYFNRFSRDANATPHGDETAIDSHWRLLLSRDAK